MNYRSNLVSESKILHGDIDPIANFCSFQDTLESKILNYIKRLKKTFNK